MAIRDKSLIVIYSLDFPPLSGGISRVSQGLAEVLNKKHPTIVLTAFHRFKQHQNHAIHAPVVRITGPPLIREILSFLFLLKLAYRKGLKVVVCMHWFPLAFVVYMLCLFTKTPYIIYAHGSDFVDDKITFKRFVKNLFKPIKRVMFNYAAYIFTVSNFTKQLLLKDKIRNNNIIVFHNAVNMQFFKPGPKSNLLPNNKTTPNGPMILTVGRLDPHKGHDIVLKAIKSLLEEFPRLTYLIVGTGPNEQYLSQLIKEFKLNNHVKLLHEIPDDLLPSLYQTCDIFVMPSRHLQNRTDLIEGFGVAFLEAAACAKPAVGTYTGGIPEAVLDGQTGILVNPDSVEELVKAIRRLLVDKSFAHLLGQNARKRVEKELNWELTAEKFLSLLTKLWNKAK